MDSLDRSNLILLLWIISDNSEMLDTENEIVEYSEIIGNYAALPLIMEAMLVVSTD